MRVGLWITVVVLLLFGCSKTESSPKNNELESSVVNRQSLITDSKILASNLTIPWDIVKVDNHFYISERDGKIVSVKENGAKVNMPLGVKKKIAAIGEGGLLGFVLDPKFENNSLAYIYHTYTEDEGIFNRIVQIRREGEKWVEEKGIIENIPGGRIHNGGRLAIGPDGKLYATVGDAGIKDSAQNLTVLSGKILRINLDGSIPSDNPFENSYIFSYGHRNPQGVTWDENGTMYSTEHGATAHDEVNLIKPGKNYGWPIIQGDEKSPGMETPLFHSGNDTWAPSGLAYHQGKLFVAELAGQQLRVFNLADKTTKPLYENVGRLRDLLIEGNSLYIITNNTDGRGIPDRDDDHLLELNLSAVKL